jgi:uroporphyrinogen III methyltransferase/synthase
MKRGKVWLVGAGPSDPGLLTLKAKKALEEAEVVLYDSLVGPGVLAMIPEGARLIDAGKRAGQAHMSQERINKTLMDEALKGFKVVRLKGGDPFLFGRGGEELELLAEHGIPFEIVPGVTSATAVPAYAGIPVTHRDFCSSVHIVAGHKKDSDRPDIDFESLTRLKGTLVFLMGAGALDYICSSLISAGMDAATPAAVLEKGTSARQRRVVATLSSLPETAARAELKTPAIIVVGAVCALTERFHWAEDRPIGGAGVVVTRPRELASGGRIT